MEGLAPRPLRERAWRRRSPAGIGASSDETLSDDDARRLDDDLGRYDL